MKKVLILICLLLVGCKANFESQSLELKEEYEELNNSGIVVNIDEEVKVKILTNENVIEFLNNDTGIVYFGFPSCPWCRNILPVLIDEMIENDKILYYVNIRNLKSEVKEKVQNYLSDYLVTDSLGNTIFYVPDVYAIKDGKIQSHHLGSVSSQTNPGISLTSEQKNELANIYQNLINSIK